jgi:sigma-B regulation protein RsbU (phosphoserine phosphatase)
LTTVAFPIAFTISIIKHHLFDIDLIIRKSLLYFLLTGALVVLYSGLTGVLGFASRHLLVAADPTWVTTLATLAAAAVFAPLRHRIQWAIDCIFYRERYNAQQALLSLGRQLATVGELNALSQRLVESVSTLLHTRSAALVTRNGSDGNFVVQRAVGEAVEREGTVISADGWVGKLAARDLPMTAPTLRPNVADGDWAVANLFHDLKAHLLVPLNTGEELVGVLSLGERLSEQPYQREDLELLNVVAGQAAIAVKNALTAQQLAAREGERQRLLHELEIGRLIQTSLLSAPLHAMGDFEIASRSDPASEVGGDFYNVFPLDENKLGIVLGDVSGKGVQGAMYMTVATTLIEAIAKSAASPRDVLREVNAYLYPRMRSIKMFVAAFYGVLDVRTGVFTFANAGQGYPLLCRDGGAQFLKAKGMPLGALRAPYYEEHQVVLTANDALVLYSDGFVEARGRSGQMLGYERFRNWAKETPRQVGVQMVEELFARATHFIHDPDGRDDLTLIVICRQGQAQSKMTSVQFPSAWGNEQRALDLVLQAAERMGLSESKAAKLKTAVREACLNAIEHGNQADPAKQVSVSVTERENALEVQVRDEGTALLPAVRKPSLSEKLAGKERQRGWGMFLISELVDEVEFITHPEMGHEVRMVVRADKVSSEQ